MDRIRHEFGIMERAPGPGERYDDYEPWKYRSVAVSDDWIEPLLPKLMAADCFWHTLDQPGKGLDYAGVTLIPPASLGVVRQVMQGFPALAPLRKLLAEAEAAGQFVIHFGI